MINEYTLLELIEDYKNSNDLTKLNLALRRFRKDREELMKNLKLYKNKTIQQGSALNFYATGSHIRSASGLTDQNSYFLVAGVAVEDGKLARECLLG